MDDNLVHDRITQQGNRQFVYLNALIRKTCANDSYKKITSNMFRQLITNSIIEKKLFMTRITKK